MPSERLSGATLLRFVCGKHKLPSDRSHPHPRWAGETPVHRVRLLPALKWSGRALGLEIRRGKLLRVEEEPVERAVGPSAVLETLFPAVRYDLLAVIMCRPSR